MGTVSRAALALDAAENALLERVRVVLSAEGCSVDEWRVLDLIADGQARVMSAVSNATSIAPSALTKLIDRMVSNNLVYRRIDTTDRRRVNIRVTPRGASSHRMLSALLDRCDTLFDDRQLQRISALPALVAELLDTSADAVVESTV